ncbi:hypothetical protein EVAR_70884_1 [Eumeta japonica]|uniref:Uncharacterized protein n=1 Tax=Eumeta variegata TaxID=151549 RepID=A0A4C2AH48_EUMVA|nr:hypothetical protein EVAR_70884_1 [Eumeta japonica]
MAIFLTDFKKEEECVRPLSLLGRIGRWSGKEIAHPAFSLARSAQAERDNESCFSCAADVHQFPPRVSSTIQHCPYGQAAPPPAPGWLVERRPKGFKKTLPEKVDARQRRNFHGLRLGILLVILCTQVGRRTSKHDLLYPRQGWAGGASFYPFAGLPHIRRRISRSIGSPPQKVIRRTRQICIYDKRNRLVYNSSIIYRDRLKNSHPLRCYKTDIDSVCHNSSLLDRRNSVEENRSGGELEERQWTWDSFHSFK